MPRICGVQRYHTTGNYNQTICRSFIPIQKHRCVVFTERITINGSRGGSGKTSCRRAVLYITCSNSSKLTTPALRSRSPATRTCTGRPVYCVRALMRSRSSFLVQARGSCSADRSQGSSASPPLSWYCPSLNLFIRQHLGFTRQ